MASKEEAAPDVARRGNQLSHVITSGMTPGSRARRGAVLAGRAFAAIGVTLILISGCATGPSLARVTHRVEMKAMRFEPAVIQVAVGDTVRWTNLDLVPHTATSRTGAFDSGNLPPDSIWVVVVAHGGVLDYSCLYHPEMKGSIVAGSGHVTATRHQILPIAAVTNDRIDEQL